MLKVRYAVTGRVVADALSGEYVDQVVKTHNESFTNGTLEVSVANSVVIDQFRVRVVRGDLKHSDIVFLYEDKQMNADKCGRLNNWPRGFCDITEDLLMEMLDADGRYETVK